MSLSYDVIEGAFLAKIVEFEFIKIPEENRNELVDGYLARAASEFRKNCQYDLTQHDDDSREFTEDFDDDDLDELVDILSEGMLVQWMKQYIYRQEVLELTLNTNDYSTYSPAELVYRVGGAYDRVKKDYTQMIREYSYNHGDLSKLHI